MKLFSTEQEHADNPPSTWRVAKRATCRWCLETRTGVVLDTFPTRVDAQRARNDSHLTRLYARQAYNYLIGVK